MASIWEGNFVLGSTSATTLSAQPGIKLDTSVPGVIGIGTDETVLWSAANLSQGDASQLITLNEPYTAFKRLKVFYKIDDGDANSTEILTNNELFDCSTQCSQAPVGAVCMWKGERYYLVNNNQISASPSASMIFWNNTTSNNTTVTAKCQAYSSFRLQQVIGINRISGGN